MPIGAKFQRLLKAQNVTVPKISNETGIPRSTLYSLLYRDNRALNQETLSCLSRYMNVPLSYFLDDDEEKVPSSETDSSAEYIHADSMLSQFLSLEAPQSVSGPGLSDVTRSVLCRLPVNCKAARLTDESMSPKYYQGVVVLADMDQNVRIGEDGLFNYDGNVVLRTLGNGFLVPYNPLFIPLTLDRQCDCIGRIRGTWSF